MEGKTRPETLRKLDAFFFILHRVCTKQHATRMCPLRGARDNMFRYCQRPTSFIKNATLDSNDSTRATRASMRWRRSANCGGGGGGGTGRAGCMPWCGPSSSAAAQAAVYVTTLWGSEDATRAASASSSATFPHHEQRWSLQASVLRFLAAHCVQPRTPGPRVQPRHPRALLECAQCAAMAQVRGRPTTQLHTQRTPWAKQAFILSVAWSQSTCNNQYGDTLVAFWDITRFCDPIF